MENLIKKSEKLTELLKELNVSKITENYQYVIKFEYKEGDTEIYSLYDRVKNTVKIDKLERIESWLNVRGVEKEKIYRI
jgi:hypothetical protein